MLRLLFLFLFSFLYSCFGAAVEDLRGTIWLLYPGDFTLYGNVHDLNNLSDLSFRAQVCWDDPAMVNNCDQPVPANTTHYPQSTCSGSNCSGFHYVIPAGQVGSVTPRDGNAHLMYVKALSNANPGAGDRQINGSPWPFTYKNGVVAPMWAPNLESSPSRLTASQLGILANSQDPYSVGTSGNVVCTISGVAIKDDGIAGYYAKRRNVPCANIAVISVPVVQTTTQTVFASSILPAVQAFSPSIQALALAWVQPSEVGYTSGNYKPQSISAAVANAGLVTGSACYVGLDLLAQGPTNPYFNSSSQAPFTDHRLRPTMMLAAETCPTCTSSNNYSPQWYANFPAAKAVIDAAIAGTDTNPSGGNVFWTLNADLVRSVTSVLVSPLELGNGLSPLANAQILGTRTTNYFDVSSKNILLYEESAPHWNYASPSFLPGAGIGFAVTSTSGWLPSDGNQTTAASWFAQGAVGAYGNAVEPCELLTYKHPDPALVIPNYTQGQTLVESLWKSVRLPWGGNFLGDPLASPFTLQSGSGGSGPVLRSISPGSAAQGSTVTVTLGGSNFVQPSNVSVSGSGVTVSNINVVNSSTITATFAVAAGAAPGAYNVNVSSAAGTSGSVAFQVTSSAPALTFISPSSGVAGSVVPVTLSGINFISGASVGVTGSGVTVSGVTVVSSSRITANFTLASNASAGQRSVSVTTTAGISNATAFTVTTAQATPTLSTISPNSGVAGSTVNVALAGTNFAAGAAIAAGQGVTVSNVVVASPTQITATFALAATAAAGARSVTVSTAAGTSNAAIFSVGGGGAMPTLTSLSPNAGTVGTSLNVNLNGTNFAAGATINISGSGVTATAVSVASSTQVKATFTVSGTAAVGSYNVTVTCGGVTTNPVAFRVTAAASAPTLTSISPSTGAAGTSVNVTLTGTNFISGTTIRLSGIGAAVRNLLIVSPTQINATFVLDSTTTPGSHDVYVANTAGNSTILPFIVN